MTMEYGLVIIAGMLCATGLTGLFLLEWFSRNKKDKEPGKQFVKWASEHDYLPHEIKLVHEFQSHNTPESDDYEYTEKWFIEEREVVY